MHGENIEFHFKEEEGLFSPPNPISEGKEKSHPPVGRNLERREGVGPLQT